MSRKYMNSKWCVRCGRKTPTPYLRKYGCKLVDMCCLKTRRAPLVLDMGCGNGRNSKFLQENATTVDVIGVDMAGDFGIQCILGQQRIELREPVNVFLMNYLCMFLNKQERKQVYADIKRLADPVAAAIMVEYYPAKDSEAKTDEDCEKLLNELIHAFKAIKDTHKFGCTDRWMINRRSKARAILTRGI